MRIFRVIQNNVRDRLPQFILLLVTAASITVSGIILGTPLLRMLPLFVSLFVMLYQSEANRFAHLAGGVNAILYAIVYFSLGLYASAGSSLLLSCPTSIIAFILWNKRAYKQSVKFRKMSPSLMIITLVLTVCLWIALYLALDPLGSPFATLDVTATVLEILVTALTLLAFREYPYAAIVHVLIALLLKGQLVLNDITNLPFLIYSCYNAVCRFRALFNVRRLYKEQSISSTQEMCNG